MNLTNNDLSGMENTFKQSSQYVSKIENFLTVVEDFKQPDEFISESYNPNTTLRKLCARTLDKLSVLFPSDVFQIVKESLERDMKNHDWNIRETVRMRMNYLKSVLEKFSKGSWTLNQWFKKQLVLLFLISLQ